VPRHRSRLRHSRSSDGMGAKAEQNVVGANPVSRSSPICRHSSVPLHRSRDGPLQCLWRRTMMHEPMPIPPGLLDRRPRQISCARVTRDEQPTIAISFTGRRRAQGCARRSEEAAWSDSGVPCRGSEHIDAAARCVFR
jgi:hypothetical protein